MADYRSLADALRAADYGVLYTYVAPSLQHGWLGQTGVPALQWYEKLEPINRLGSAAFLTEIGADEQFAFVAVGQGFVIFVAHSPAELSKERELVRPWVESLIQSYVADGLVNPKTYVFPSERGLEAERDLPTGPTHPILAEDTNH